MHKYPECWQFELIWKKHSAPLNFWHFCKFCNKRVVFRALQVWIEHPPVVTERAPACWYARSCRCYCCGAAQAWAGDFLDRAISTVNHSLERGRKPIWREKLNRFGWLTEGPGSSVPNPPPTAIDTHGNINRALKQWTEASWRDTSRSANTVPLTGTHQEIESHFKERIGFV